MSFAWKIIIHVLANALAILAAGKLLSGFVFRGDWKDLVIAGAVLGIVNSLIRPVVKLLSLPFIILTLGFFSVLINIAMLLLADKLLHSILIRNFWSAFWGVVIISLVNHIILTIAHKTEK